MVIPKEKLTDIKEKYEKAYQLVDEESKNDPPTDPFRSHYDARDILMELMGNIKNSMDSEEDDSHQVTFKVILAFVYRDLGRINVFCEEVSQGEKYLHHCLDLIEEIQMRQEAIISYVGALNELGIVWANRKEYKKSEEFLKRSEAAYKKFKQSELPAMALTDIFGAAEEIEHGKGEKELEKLHTLTTFYVAQILGHLGDMELSAQYCNLTLKRQVIERETLDSIDWSLNAATLSQYYLNINNFSASRHHLAAATLIMAEYEEKMITPDMNSDSVEAVKENFNHRYADIARCWAKYGLALLSSSKERLLADDDEKINADISVLTMNDYKFENLDLTASENGISDKYCLTFDDAKLVFHFVIMWLDRAKEYFKPETEASEYAKIIIDFAELYKTMAFFDDIPSNQSKMHKKRADYLEDLLNILNPTYYLAICRECWYDCGLAYAAMLDVKLDALMQLKYDEKPTPHQLQKINMLCEKAIKHFMKFADSYRDGDKLKDGISPLEKQLYLYANFHMGRLFYKINTPDKTMEINNLKNSLHCYKTFVTESAADEEASKSLQAEIGVSKEMITLLPHKQAKLINELELHVEQ